MVTGKVLSLCLQGTLRCSRKALVYVIGCNVGSGHMMFAILQDGEVACSGAECDECDKEISDHC